MPPMTTIRKAVFPAAGLGTRFLPATKAQPKEMRKITRMLQVSYVRQGEPLGLGHAVLVAKNLVGNEPFAVILGDDVIDATPPALKQMIDVYQRVKGPVL